jgi:hypothetical protein
VACRWRRGRARHGRRLRGRRRTRRAKAVASPCRSSSRCARPPAKLCVFSTETQAVRTKNGPRSGASRPSTAARSTYPRGSVHVRIVTPEIAPCAPISARAMWADDSHSTSSPAFTSTRTASRLASEPVTVNSADSNPNMSATRASRALTVGSSPYTSSPTSATAIACRIASVGRVTVSLRRSTTLSPPFTLHPFPRREGGTRSAPRMQHLGHQEGELQ